MLGHVDRESDDASLLGDAARNRLAHPPGGVGGELETLGVVELLDRTDQTGIAFLDQVQQRHLCSPILAGHGDHQPQIGGDEALHCCGAFSGNLSQFVLGGLDGVGRGILVAQFAVKNGLGVASGFDQPGQLDLVGRGEKWGLGYPVQVQPHGVLAIDAVRATDPVCG